MRILLFTILVSLVASCSPLLITGDKASNTVLNYKIKEAFRALEDSYTDMDYVFYENNHTYIEEGLRYNYGLLNQLASVSILEKAIGEKVFLNGPHQNGLDFFSSDSFGYYNPAFWEKVKTVVAYSLENDGTFKQLGKYAYDRHLKKEVQLYYDSYQYLSSNKSMAQQVTKDYQAAMQDGGNAGELLQESFRAFADSKEQLGEDWYVANTAPGFWIRRQIDGTADKIFEVVELVRKTYN